MDLRHCNLVHDRVLGEGAGAHELQDRLTTAGEACGGIRHLSISIARPVGKWIHCPFYMYLYSLSFYSSDVQCGHILFKSCFCQLHKPFCYRLIIKVSCVNVKCMAEHVFWPLVWTFCFVLVLYASCTCVGFLPAMLTQVSLWALTEPALSTLRDEEGNDLITCKIITTQRRGQYTTCKPEKRRIVNSERCRCSDLVWTLWLQVQCSPPHQPPHVQGQQESPPYAFPQTDGTSRCDKHL